MADMEELNALFVMRTLYKTSFKLSAFSGQLLVFEADS